MDGWFGPKLICMMSSVSRSSAGTSRIVGTRCGMREPSYCGGATTGQAAGRLLGRDRHSASENRTGSPPIG